MSRLSVVFAVLLAGPAWAGAKMDRPIGPGFQVTYRQLLQLICSDIRINPDDPTSATATRAIAIRELASSEEAQPQIVEEGEPPLRVEGVGTVALSTTPTPRVLVTFTMPISQDVPERALAVFDLAATPKLVDVVAVPAFPDDAGDYTKSLRLDDATSAYVFESHHFNSSQGYDGYTLLFLRGNRLEQIETVGALSCKGCESGSFEERVDLSTVPDAGRPYNRIVVRVRFQQLPDKRHRAAVRTYAAEYRWDASVLQFLTSSNELEQLKAVNQKNY